MEDEYEVRAVAEEAVEEAARRGGRFEQRIALFSAILATLGAVASFLGGYTLNEALYHKNDAILAKAHASDLWSYYQAEELKRHIADVAAIGAPPTAAPSLRAAGLRYRAKAETIRAAADRYDQQSAVADAASDRSFAPHVRLALAVPLIQIAIALASITALTRKRWLFGMAVLFAGVAILAGLTAVT